MPATVHGEAFISRSRSGNAVDFVYIVRDSDDEIAAVAAALAVAPSTYGALVRKDIDVGSNPLRITGDDDGWYEIRVPYAAAEWDFQTGPNSYTFDTAGGTAHITQSLNIPSAYGLGTPPDIGIGVGGPIGANSTGVEGVDIPVPQFEWEETHLFSWGDIDEAYKDRVAELTGRVNNATFFGSDAGEILFLGAHGGRLPDNTAAITFRFAKNKNHTDLVVGALDGISKKGWQYLDVYYEDREIGTGADKILIQMPRYVYIHDIFYEDDFGDLGIGT